MIISVFGGSQPDEETRELAYELGKRIAAKGYVLKNGGNDGTMEAAAKGAREKDGKVIGVIVSGSKLIGLDNNNSYSTETMSFEKYGDRVKELMKAGFYGWDNVDNQCYNFFRSKALTLMLIAYKANTLALQSFPLQEEFPFLVFQRKFR